MLHTLNCWTQQFMMCISLLCLLSGNMVHAGIHAGMNTGDGTWIDKQLLCRHEQNQYYNLEPESHYLWPYGEFLRLYRIAHLPLPLPDIRTPLMPPLQPGFTAAQALRRVTVKGSRHNHNGCQPPASMFPEQLVACICGMHLWHD